MRAETMGTGLHEGDAGGPLSISEGVDARESESGRAGHVTVCLCGGSACLHLGRF